MVKDYAEQILQAVDIVVGQRLNDISFDRSENCTIISDKDKKNGCYEVSNGSTKYKAYVEATGSNNVPDYKINDTVQVRIPNGDFSQKKYIVCKCVIDNDTSPITYVSPLDTVLDMTDNIISGEKIRGLRANDANQQQWCLWSADCSQPAYRKLQNNGLYDTIAIKADFKTLLAGYNVNKGNYGLRLDMYFKPTNNTDKVIVHSAYLDSSDMYGNPYSFLVYSTQAAKFSIANIGTIQTISLYFYQNNNFTYLTDSGVQKYLPVLRAEDADYSNLLLKNVYLSFGSDIINIDDNTVKLYTNEPLEYDRLADDESTNTKGIGLLWYNKNDVGQYLGYSDGIVDKDYDEIAYLQLSEKDSRLLAQQGKDVPLDESGLDLSADIVEAEKLLKKLKTSITQDLYQMLWAFQSRIEGVVNDKGNEDNNLSTLFNNLLHSQNGLIASAGKDLDINTEDMVDYYLAKLSNARAKMDKVEYTPTTLSYTLPDKMMKSPQDVVTAIKSGNKDQPGLLESAYEIIKKHYAGFMSLYDSFNTKLSKLTETTQSYINEFLLLTEGNQSRIDAYFKNGYKYEPYVTEVDETLYQNRYCIYWYKYIPGYVDETERFMDNGWKRLTEYNNHGLPSATVTIDGVEYYEKRPDIGEDSIVQILDTELSEEKYCVIIFYNHTMYKSEPLVFTNQNPPQDGTASDQNGALYIEHGNNSRGTYQSYGVNNMLINVADAYQTRTLSAHYEGILGQDEVLAGGQVFWYIPKNATMLTYDLNEYGTDFTNDIYDSVQSPNSMEGYTCFYRTIKESDDALTFTYHIKDYYVPTSTNNEIICKVITKDNRTLEANILFNFSSYGTSGTDYTLVITPAGFQNAITEEYDGTQFLDFKVSLYDYNNELMDIPVASLSVDECGFIGPAQKPYEVQWLAGENVVELGVDTEGVLTGCRVWIPTYSKGPGAGYYYGILQVAMEFTLPEMVDEKGVITQKERTINLTSYCTLPYSQSLKKDENGNVTEVPTKYHGQIYIEGPSIIVYDSSGTNPTYYRNPYKAYSNYLNSENDPSLVKKDQEIEGISWMMKYYDEDGNDIDIADLSDEDKQTYQLLINWMPKLSSDNKLLPASMYLEEHPESTSHLYPVVVGLLGQTVIWAQPIYLLQNKYESAMLNKWDGSLCIDEENGTIMAPMVGAGRKTVNNTFEGVLMGDVGAKADVYSDNAEGIGLYGFHDGAQSFHFGIDGTAFIGKSGRGRIRFDGNSGTIASASYYATRENQQSAGDAGMLIDLDDGYIDIKGVAVAANPDYTGSITYEKDINHQAHITLNARADDFTPYFRITSPRINAETEFENVDLIYVGLDGYHLQSSNYDKPDTVFAIADNQPNTPGSGMKIDLQGAFIDAFNLRLQSQNILIDCVNEDGPYFVIKSGSTTEALTSFRNLMYVGKDTYYLQTADYKDKTSGLKIDLASGTIKAYNSFSLEAGSEANGGVMLNAAPGSGQNYLFAGKTSVGYIKVDNTGAMSLFATKFTLQTSNIYLSDTGTTWEGHADTVLGLGAKFAVDSKGNLTANDATINNLTAVGGNFSGTIASSATISGGTIMGSVIKNGNGSFEVTADGHLTAKSATIGGWSVNPDNITNKSSGFTLDPNTGISSSYLNTDKDGMTTIKKLTVEESAFFTSTCKVGINTAAPASSSKVDLKINGQTHMLGNIGIGVSPSDDYVLNLYGDVQIKVGSQIKSSSSTGEYVSFATNGLFLYGKLIDISSEEIEIGASARTSASGSASQVEFWGDATTYGKFKSTYEASFGGDILFDGVIKAKIGDAYQPGINGTYKVETGWWSSKQLTFKKGLLVAINGKNEDDETVDAGFTGDIGTSNKPIYIDGGNFKECTLGFPSSKGTSGQVMKSNGDGTTSWTTISTPTSVSYATNAGYADSAGSSSSASKVYVNSGGHKGWVLTCNAGAGNSNIYGASASSLVTASSSSSRRFKNHITDIPVLDSEIIYKLNPVQYMYNEGCSWDNNNNIHYGFIAEDVVKLNANLVAMSEEDETLCQGLYYNSILTLAVAEIQKLKKEINELKTQISN